MEFEQFKIEIVNAIKLFDEKGDPTSLIQKWTLEKLPLDSINSTKQYCQKNIDELVFYNNYNPLTDVQKLEYQLFKNLLRELL
jgi:imidazole glycerol phosphate synthase subunit HisF